MTHPTDPRALIEQLVKVINRDGHQLGCKVHAFSDKCTCGLDETINAVLTAATEYLKQPQGESILIDGRAYEVPSAVAAELLRLHLELLRPSKVSQSDLIGALRACVCDTCGGDGTIDETLGGYAFSNPKAQCPDCDGRGAIIIGLAALLKSEPTGGRTDTNRFKNFHRSLCNRFGYTHDEKDWRRDLVSLEEHIAAKVAAPTLANTQLVAIQKIMARLSYLLDEDQFAEIESMALRAGATHPQATEPAPIGINGLTEAETSATMSVRGLSEPAPSTAGDHVFAEDWVVREDVLQMARATGAEEVIDNWLFYMTGSHLERFATLLQSTPARKPLTIDEVEQILAQHNYEIHGDRARYIVRMTERAHGITKKGQQ